MNNTHVLAFLIDHVNVSGKPVAIGWDEVVQWQDESLKSFKFWLLIKNVNVKLSIAIIALFVKTLHFLLNGKLLEG